VCRDKPGTCSHSQKHCAISQ